MAAQKGFLPATILLILLAFINPVLADGIENAGTIVAVALPLAAGGISAWKEDWTGLAELGVGTGLSVGTAYGLKHVVREERPDHSDFKSFPSDTTALAFAPAAYLWDRYGWKYGGPAYIAASFVAYSRVDSKKHHWWDVVASAGIAWGYSQLITTHYQGPNLYSSAYATPDGGYVKVGYRW